MRITEDDVLFMKPMAPPVTQNADVRFLGRLLGGVIRTFGGDALFDRIEAIRAASVDRYRGVSNPRTLGSDLQSLSLDETLAFVRSFMLFSMLANLAEDRQVAATEQEGLASAVRFLAAQGVHETQIAQLLQRAMVVPVLTAHPTEVMRKSMLDHRNRIAALMRRRDAGQLETSGGQPIEEAIAGQIALLWQTSCRRSPCCTRVGSGCSACRRRAFYGSAAGSAAIATAIRMSRRILCGSPSGGRARLC